MLGFWDLFPSKNLIHKLSCDHGQVVGWVSVLGVFDRVLLYVFIFFLLLVIQFCFLGLISVFTFLFYFHRVFVPRLKSIGNFLDNLANLLILFGFNIAFKILPTLWEHFFVLGDPWLCNALFPVDCPSYRRYCVQLAFDLSRPVFLNLLQVYQIKLSLCVILHGHWPLPRNWLGLLRLCTVFDVGGDLAVSVFLNILLETHHAQRIWLLAT